MLKVFVFIIYSMNISLIVTHVPGYYWRDYIPGDIPCDAFKGAPGKYIGQIYIQLYEREHIIPATIHPHRGIAFGEYGGKQTAKEHIKILCSPDNSRFYWEDVDLTDTNDKKLTENAVIGAHDNVENVFIGRKFDHEEWMISKAVLESEPNLFHAWTQFGYSHRYPQFQLLKYNTTEIYLKQFTQVADYYWRDYVPGDIPCDAFKGAPGKYVGQMFVELNEYHHVIPATIHPHRGLAFGEFGGRKTSKEHIKILCSPDNSKFYWEDVELSDVSDKKLIENAVIGGHDDVMNIFIGKKFDHEEWMISKAVLEDDTQLFHAWTQYGYSHRYPQFQLLKYNTTQNNQKQCNVTISFDKYQ